MQPRFTEGGQTLQQRYRQQTHFGRLFVRTVFRHHQRCKTQRYRTVQRSNDVMAVRIFAEPNLFAFLGTYKRDASENFQTTLLHCWGLTQSMLVRRYKKISKYRQSSKSFNISLGSLGKIQITLLHIFYKKES